MPFEQTGSFGARFGGTLGSQLAQTLENLSHAKAYQIQQQQQDQLLRSNLNPEEYNLVKLIPQAERGKFFMGALQGGWRPGALGQSQQPVEVKPDKTARQELQQLMEPQQQITPQQRQIQAQSALAQIFGMPSPFAQQQAPQNPFLSQLSQSLQQLQPQQRDLSNLPLPQQEIMQQQSEQPAAQPQVPVQVQPQIPKKVGFSEALQNAKSNTPALQQRERFFQAKQEKEQEKLNKAEQHKADKETQTYYVDQLKADKAAEAGDKRLNRMEYLVDKGSLPFAAFHRLFENLSESKAFSSVPIVGSILDAATHAIGESGKIIQKEFTSRDAEEFDKLSKDFVRDAKSIFGARITDTDLRTFMDMIPQLAQTDHGKKQIIKNMRSFNDVIHIRTKAMKDIIKANGGTRPRDIETQVEELVGPELDAIAKNFEIGTTEAPIRYLPKSR